MGPDGGQPKTLGLGLTGIMIWIIPQNEGRQFLGMGAGVWVAGKYPMRCRDGRATPGKERRTIFFMNHLTGIGGNAKVLTGLARPV